LGAGTFEVSVVKEQLQPANNLLLAAADEGNDLMGMQKTVAVD